MKFPLTEPEIIVLPNFKWSYTSQNCCRRSRQSSGGGDPMEGTPLEELGKRAEISNQMSAHKFSPFPFIFSIFK